VVCNRSQYPEEERRVSYMTGMTSTTFGFPFIRGKERRGLKKGVLSSLCKMLVIPLFS